MELTMVTVVLLSNQTDQGSAVLKFQSIKDDFELLISERVEPSFSEVLSGDFLRTINDNFL